MASIGVKVDNVSKYFGDLAAVDNLSLEIEPTLTIAPLLTSDIFERAAFVI